VSTKYTREYQYQFMIDMMKDRSHAPMGLRASMMWRLDPKLLGITLARHKFVAKMLTGYSRVLEVGCGDAFASRVLHPEVEEMHAIDFDDVFIEEARKHLEPEWPVTLAVHDMLTGPYCAGGAFDAAFSLDVIEHIPIESEDSFLRNICLSIKPGGAFVCGSPSLESQEYASAPSREGHVNCKTGPDWKKLIGKYFDHVFLFGMNDEVLHTGFSPMCHYLFVLATGNKVKG
jgi:2-polyprenyl-3-methyl-5-hydroxy-6-metoxy-1,4-benzoquinol methylase